MILTDLRSAIRSGVLALCLMALVGATPSFAQETGEAGGTTTTTQTEDDDQDWGWIGLLGLAGLAGLLRRDRPRDHVDSRPRV